MLRAAAGLAAVVAGEVRRRRGRLYGARVVLLVGTGSNGGDALHAGARLAAGGAQVTALLAGPTPTPGGFASLRAAGGRVLPGAASPGELDRPSHQDDDDRGRAASASSAAEVALSGADVVLDGLLGTGGRPGLDAAAAGLVAAVPPAALVVAVDVPSGVDADSGELPRAADGRPSCVHADLTVTFGTAKPALLLPPAAARGRARRRRRHRARPRRAGTGGGGGARPRAGRPAVAGAGAAGRQVLPRRARGGGRRRHVHRGGAAVHHRRRALGRRDGPLRRPSEAHRAGPAAAAGGGPRRRPRAGVGRRLRSRPRRRRPGRTAGAGARRCRRRRRAVPAGRRCAARARGARASGWPARPGGHRSAPDAARGESSPDLLAELGGEDGERVGRSAVEERPLEHVLRAARATGAVVLLKGSTTLLATPDGRVRSQTDGRAGWARRAPETSSPASPACCSRPAWRPSRPGPWPPPSTAAPRRWRAPVDRCTPRRWRWRCRAWSRTC
ncbi:MAG: hypothetical protein PGN11_15520 [Quadrisphaera sp.]